MKRLKIFIQTQDNGPVLSVGVAEACLELFSAQYSFGNNGITKNIFQIQFCSRNKNFTPGHTSLYDNVVQISKIGNRLTPDPHRHPGDMPIPDHIK